MPNDKPTKPDKPAKPEYPPGWGGLAVVKWLKDCDTPLAMGAGTVKAGHFGMLPQAKAEQAISQGLAVAVKENEWEQYAAPKRAAQSEVSNG